MSKALDIGIEAQHRAADTLSSLANLTEYAHRMEQLLESANAEIDELDAEMLTLRRGLVRACRAEATRLGRVDEHGEPLSDAVLEIRQWYTTEEMEG